MADTTYNGWTNYETWLVNLWIDNDGYGEYLNERAQECLQEAFDNADLETTTDDEIRNDATYALSKAIEEYHDELQEECGMPSNGVFADLLGAALRSVNWHEIAEHMVADADMPERETTDAE
jgi:hypothetical protein